MDLLRDNGSVESIDSVILMIDWGIGKLPRPHFIEESVHVTPLRRARLPQLICCFVKPILGNVG